MAEHRYLFIDGPYFENVKQSIGAQIAPNAIVPIDYIKLGNGFERIIYFDALPVKKSGQSPEEFQAEYDEKVSFLDGLRRVPRMHVRDGLTRVRARTGREQKGVDTWIAIEAMQYAFRGIITEATVITGDLDLYPLFEALLQTNTRGVLWFEPGTCTDELIMAADVAEPMSAYFCGNGHKRTFIINFTRATS